MGTAQNFLSAPARRSARRSRTGLVLVDFTRTALSNPAAPFLQNAVGGCNKGIYSKTQQTYFGLPPGHAAENEREKPCAEQDTEIVNITKAELLRRATKCVTTGFVPPILARLLYQDVHNSSWGPWDAVTKGWSWDLPSDLPHLTSRRELGPYGQFEVVKTEVRWFASSQAAEDYSYVLQHAGLSAASSEPNPHDPLLRHGPPSEYRMDSRPLVSSLQDPLLRKASFGVRVA
eukprot:3249434-Rhodomonas_salina.3